MWTFAWSSSLYSHQTEAAWPGWLLAAGLEGTLCHILWKQFANFILEVVSRRGRGGGAQPGEGEGEREGDKGEEPALQHSGAEIMGAGCDDLEDMTDLSDRTDYCPLCVTRP